ncbi:MAG: hypothetical protein IPG54_09365 [Sphingomonadales bacterium]|nr:hypothetical protein [Sphingomonadales bacterium]
MARKRRGAIFVRRCPATNLADQRLSVDFWSIAVDDTISSLTIRQLPTVSTISPIALSAPVASSPLLDLHRKQHQFAPYRGLEIALRARFDVGRQFCRAGWNLFAQEKGKVPACIALWPQPDWRVHLCRRPWPEVEA